MTGWDMAHCWGGWGDGGWLLWIVLVVLIVVGIVWLVRELGDARERERRPRSRSAVAEVELRYARGEVDRETYLAIRRDLEADGT
jgi:putative membrane protein